MNDQLNISPKPHRHRGNGTYLLYPIDEMHGTVLDGKTNNRHGVTPVTRFRDYGYNVNTDGRKGHQLYYYNHHQGAWSNGATHNRALMAMAAAKTRLEIKDDTLGPQWQSQFKQYTLAKSQHPNEPRYTSLYTYVYRLTYDSIKSQLQSDLASHQRTDLVSSFADAFRDKRERELSTHRDIHLTGPQVEQLARTQTDDYINSLL